jgi:hypothetical protein
LSTSLGSMPRAVELVWNTSWSSWARSSSDSLAALHRCCHSVEHLAGTSSLRIPSANPQRLAKMERFFSNPSNAPRRDADTDTGITLLSGPPCWYAPHCSPCPAQTSPFWHALRRDRNGATVDLSTPSDHAVPLFWCKVSGKTSLLFQFAVNRAAESGRGVVFICNKGRLESNPPFLSQVKSLRLLGSVAHAGEEQAAKGCTCWVAVPRF